MENNETYKPILLPTGQPGQAYLVTFCLWNAEAHDTLASYTQRLKELQQKIEYRKKHQLFDQILTDLASEYNLTRSRYSYAYDHLMAQNEGMTIDLNKPEISAVITHAFSFLGDTHVENYAWCIMPNHIYWVFKTREMDHEGNPVHLSEIMEAVKKHTARNINKLIGRKGPLWQKESFNTALKDLQQLHQAIEYTLNNPVAAKLTDDPNQWPGSWVRNSLSSVF